MGLISFVKNAGRKLGIDLGAREREKEGAGVQQGRTVPAGQSPAGQTAPAVQTRENLDRQKAAALVKLVQQMGFNVEDLGVRVDDDKATLTGKVQSQEQREKIVLLVGNTEGIANVDDRLQVERPEPEAVYYEVKSGDTLSKIAKEHYGDANKYHQIFEANRPMLKDPDEIFPGQKLRLPGLAAVGTGQRA